MELQQQQLVNTQFGFGLIKQLPREPAPEPLISEEELAKQNIPVPPPLPPLDKQQTSSLEDPLPFLNSQSFQGQEPVVQTDNRKAPLIKRLTNDLQESMNLAKKLEQKLKYSYSNDERMVEVDLKYCTVSAQVKNISNVLILLIKTFFGQRHYYLVVVPITHTVEQLRQLIIEGIGQNPKLLHNIKLISPICQLRELNNMSVKVSELGLKDFSQLLFLAQMTFIWDPIKKGKSITLSNSNNTANKQGESDYQTVLGTLAMSSGRHYWELKIDKYVDEEDIFIGIARKEIDLYVHPTTTQQFYGYICLCARKFGIDGQIQNYGYASKQNDIIGVLLEFRSGNGVLSFYRNGVKCGEAFNNLTGTFYPALSMFYGEVQVTLDARAPLPPS